MDENATMGERTKIRTALASMEVGDVISFELERLASVRTMASEYGLQAGRRYSTATDREARTITVTRID